MIARRHAQLRLIDAHFACAISLAQERVLREHLPGCAMCRAHYDRHLLLQSLDPIAVGPEERLGLALGIASPERPRAHWSLALAAVMALAVGWTIAQVAAAPHLPEFAARGAASPIGDKPELFIYRIRHDLVPETIVDRIAAGDELAFAYANPAGFAHLSILGIDEHVYWYHPAWTNEQDDPSAIPIASGAELHELSEAVKQPLDGKTLRVVALFTHQPVKVKEVEAMVRGAARDRVDLAGGIPGAVQIETQLWIEP